MTVTGTYDSYLVALSFAVASFASYTALDLGGRIRASKGWARVAWLATAATAMGGHLVDALHRHARLSHADAGQLRHRADGSFAHCCGGGDRRRLLCHRHTPSDTGPIGPQRPCHGHRNRRHALHGHGCDAHGGG